jgi:hypothetical protein
MKIVFLLPTGAVEWQVPEMDPPFNFGLFVNSIRASGYFMSEHLYIRHDGMVGISVAQEGVQPPAVRKDLQ